MVEAAASPWGEVHRHLRVCTNTESAMGDLRIKDIDESEIDTVLAEDIDFTGELVFNKPLMIKGKFSGNIRADGDLYVGDRADVEATVTARVVSVKGRVCGNISAAARVEAFSSAVIEGDIATPDVVMESGCRFNGRCAMTPREDGAKT